MKAKKYILLLMVAGGMATSCDSLLNIAPPSDALTSDQVFASEETISVAANGLYTQNFLNNSLYYFATEMCVGLCSDELRYTRTNFAEYEKNEYTPTSSKFASLWRSCYSSIYQSNDFIAHVEGTKLLPEKKRDAFLGEARWFRAYCHLLLVNMFGDVPLVMTNDVSKTQKMPRTPKSDVYKQIIEDLQIGAESLVGSPNKNTKLTSAACNALLSRAYLYTEDWANAVAAANKVIPARDGGSGSDALALESPENVFKSASRETILQGNMEGFVGIGTYVGFVPLAMQFVNRSYYIQEGLADELLSNPKDKRIGWIKRYSRGDNYYPYKYQNRSTPSDPAEYQYNVLLRLAEQYLIRAEANVHLGKLEAALADINLIRARAGIEKIEAVTTAEDLLMAIETERRKEFFAEGYHRWADLNRTGRAEAVYKACGYKSGWDATKALFPIPDNEIAMNPHLEQNKGY